MSHVLRIGLLFSVLGAAGCGSEPPAAPVASGDNESEITAALDKLSADDRSLAVAQRNCPVSGHRLGSMDAPVMVEVNGRKVLLCCESCREPILTEPEKFLAKLGPLVGQPAK
jgi:hypothetical protein